MQPPSSETRYVTFSKIHDARTGNILFQYLFAIYISFKYGHTYIAVEDFLQIAIPSPIIPVIKLTDHNQSDISADTISTSHIICEGFFQRDEYYVPIRERLLQYLKDTNDYWTGFGGNREYIRDFLTSPHSVDLKPDDIVISLRLDDFIQLPNPKSDIVHPRFYMDVLEKWFSTNNRSNGRLFIVCDKLRHYWEHKYIEYFQKWSPILIQNTILRDCALMRDCQSLVHSNSTLCWFMSFLSEKTHRFIPVTKTYYPSQHLEAICAKTDTVTFVDPMSHHDVYGLNVMCDHRDLQSLPYCIPDEIFVEEPLDISDKKYVMSPLIPGNASNHLFRAGEEKSYYNMYRDSMFAVTKRKGGWDCLRHYEIVANGCIPVFEDLEDCPPDTLSTFPKDLLKGANRALLPWTNTPAQQAAYPIYCSQLLKSAKSNCSASATASAFLSQIGASSSSPKILMLVGDAGVNYTRELTWIGVKRLLGVNAVEWPALNYLYESFPEERLSTIYGNGFTYSRRLADNLRVTMSEAELITSITEKRWDFIIYGKVGPDEMHVGSVPNLPFWTSVFKRYSRDEIVFWYGGDGMQDMTWANRYSEHLARHCQYAKCFVREFIRWNGTF